MVQRPFMLAAMLLSACFWWKPYHEASGTSPSGPSSGVTCETNAECAESEACLFGKCAARSGAPLTVSLVRGTVADASAPNGFWLNDHLIVQGSGFVATTTARIGVFSGAQLFEEAIPVISVTENQLDIGPLPPFEFETEPSLFTLRLTDPAAGVVDRPLEFRHGRTGQLSAGANITADTSGTTTTLGLANRFDGYVRLDGEAGVALQVASGKVQLASATVHMPFLRVVKAWGALGEFTIDCGSPGYQVVSGSCGCAGAGKLLANERADVSTWRCYCSAAPPNTTTCGNSPIPAGCHVIHALCLKGDTSP